jgi:phosphohistidine phosphatase SixA
LIPVELLINNCQLLIAQIKQIVQLGLSLREVLYLHALQLICSKLITMRFTLAIAFISLLSSGCGQQRGFGDNAKIYLVRHAEKEKGDDPLLTEGGNKRAGDLLRTLKNKNIRRIYVTEYKRTQNTGDSLRIQLGIDTVHYVADTTGEDLARKIIEHNDVNAAILVIGHSNTIPKIIQRLALPGYPRDYIPDKEFDNLFLLQFKNGEPSLERMKYGASSGSSATMQ